jgi:hypothetical protein
MRQLIVIQQSTQSPTATPHKQSLASSPNEAADRPSSSNQVEGADTIVCDGTGAHTEPSRAYQTIAVAETEPTNATVNSLESTLGSDTTTSVQQTGE